MTTYGTLISALLGGVLGAALTVAALDMAGVLTPAPTPVAVVNLAGLIKGETGGKPVDAAAVKAGFAKMRQVGEALAAQGYVVLDASAVIDAPDEFYVPARQVGDGPTKPK